MGAYAGVNGVVREYRGFDVGVNGNVQHCWRGVCGVNGVARDFMKYSDTIERLELRVEDIRIDKSSSDGSGESVSTTLATASKYADINVSSNSFGLVMRKSGVYITLDAYLYAVYKDGHKEVLLSRNYAEQSYDISCTVDWRLGRNGSSDWWGTFGLYAFGKFLPKSVSESVSKTFTGPVDDDLTHYFGCSTGMKYGNSLYTSMTLRSIKMDGRSIPFKVVNYLS